MIDRGRRPEIAGTRITVYDVLDDVHASWHAEHMAGLFRLPSKRNGRAIARSCTGNAPHSGRAKRQRRPLWAVMADHDVAGQRPLLLRLLTSPAWQPLWAELAVRVASCATPGLSPHTTDAGL